MRSSPKNIRIFGILTAASLLLCGCGQNGKNGQSDMSTLEKVKQRGVVRIGYANEAPYAYLDTQTGEVIGEAPAIARVVLKKMGINKIEGVLTEFGSLIPGLKARRFDMIAAGMYITPPRCKEVAFSDPSYTIGEAFIVKAGNPLDLHSYEDVAGNPDATIGVVVGTVERGYAEKLGVPEKRITIFSDTPSALAGVLTGRVDAYAGTDLTVTRLLKEAARPELEKAEPFQDPIIEGEVPGGYGAFAFHKKDNAFLKEYNRHLNDFIGTKEHLALLKPFGFTKENLPGEMSADKICGQ